MASNEAIAVPDMDAETAAQVLQRALIAPAHLNCDETMLELLKLLTFLPLAIVQAATYINANQISVAEYLSLLNEADDTVVQLLSEDFEDDGRYLEAMNPVAMTWLVSFKHIQSFDPLAAEYLSFMACLEPKMIPSHSYPNRSPKRRCWKR
jgi:hypothetical protein